MYTDSRITSQVQRPECPYSFLNTVPRRDEPDLIQASIILRIDFHLIQEQPDFSRTDASLYHNGLITDEIAALTSLCTGVRMKVGGMSRRFRNNDPDPLGQPVAWGLQPIPTLDLNKDRLVLPHVIRTASLDELNLLDQLLRISPRQAVALIRSARLYQDALWLAESEPALAWLMFVSALETAADEWRSEQGTALERLWDARPNLAQLLLKTGGDAFVAEVASQIEPSLGATKKFVEFTLAHIPPPPDKRPSEAFQVPWDKKHMKKVLSLVYGYRSKALHGGTPFPAPMCSAASQLSSTDEYVEVGTVGRAASKNGGVWLAKDLPISLHTFHYIVRNTLLRWWAAMANG